MMALPISAAQPGLSTISLPVDAVAVAGMVVERKIADINWFAEIYTGSVYSKYKCII